MLFERSDPFPVCCNCIFHRHARCAYAVVAAQIRLVEAENFGPAIFLGRGNVLEPDTGEIWVRGPEHGDELEVRVERT